MSRINGKKTHTNTILYYTILYYTILYYTILYYTIIYYTILYYTIPYYTILYYTIYYILYYTILYYTIPYDTILYYTILYYTILYYILYYTILYYTKLYFFFSFFFFNLTYSRWTSSLTSCLWSQRIFPSLPGSRLTIFLSRCKFSTLTTRQPMVDFYLLAFPRFPLRKNRHKSYKGKNRTHDFRTSRYAGYPLDHSGDERLLYYTIL